MMRKIPIVKQRDLRDCGPCCLLSVIKYYDGFIPLEKIRLDSYTDNNGTTAWHMINSLSKYGFDAYGSKVDIKDFNSKNLVLPLIAHLNLKNGLNHYVVIYKISKNNITVMDPYKGIVKMKHKDFFDIFSGIIISLFPKSDSIISYSNSKLKSKFFNILLSNNKKIFIKILSLNFLIVIFTILSGLYFKIGFNNLNDNKILRLIMFLFLFFLLSKILFEYLSAYFKNHLIKNIDFKLNREFFKKLFNFPSKVVKNRSVGEIATRVTELNNLHEIITDVIVTIIINLFLAICTFIILYFIDITLLKILILFTSIFILICLISNKFIYKMIKQNIESNEIFNSEVIEYCNAFESIKNNNIENFILSKLDNTTINYLKSNYKITNTLNKINLFKNLCIDLMQYTIITTGFILLINNKLTLIDFITFETILVYLVEPVKNILNIIPKFNYLKASLEKIDDFLSLMVENLNNKEDFINGDIIVNDLSFSYNDYNHVLSNINLVIKQNSHVMIKGNSGIGKSTFCKLLNRTYDYNGGDIKIGLVSLKDYSLATIRKNILYLSQNEFLFDDTIKNNIILDSKYNINKFNYICKICHLEEIVKNKPLRYETFINKDFANLSGGEKQRIILARALYRDFKILILDEALSEVNINLEKNIIHSLRHFLSNKTLIYVTHKNHNKCFDNVLELGDNNE